MDCKYIKKDRKVFSYTPLSFISALSNIENSIVQGMTGDDIMAFLGQLPAEIRIVLDSLDLIPEDLAKDTIDESDYDSFSNYKQIIIRVNGLIPKYAKEYMKRPVIPASAATLIPDLHSKDEFNQTIGPIPTVAALKNFPKTRDLLESTVGLKGLYTEIHELGQVKPKTRGKLNRKDENNILVSGGFDLELLGNFKECTVSLADIYMFNNKLRDMLLSGRGLGLLSKAAISDKICSKGTPDSAYAAVAAYYGCIDTEDTFKYESLELMSVEKFLILLGKFRNSAYTKEYILKHSDYCGIDPNKYMSRYSAIKLAYHNLGSKVFEVFTDTIKDCEETVSTASTFFNDIAEGSEYDTPEIASYYVAGVIQSDEYGNARMFEGMNMSKALRIIFSILESTVKIDFNTTEYIDIDKCTGQA